MSTDIDVWGDEDEHPAAYTDDPTPILHNDPDWARHAAYHLRRLAAWQARYNEIEQAFTREIERLEQRRSEALGPIDAKIVWHRRPLVQLHEQILVSEPDRKTLTLPGGVIKSRTPTKPSVDVVDKDEFASWAHVHAPHLLRVAFSPDKKAIDKAIGDNDLVVAGDPSSGDPVNVVDPGTGETLPGVQVRLAARTFSVVADGDGAW